MNLNDLKDKQSLEALPICHRCGCVNDCDHEAVVTPELSKLEFSGDVDKLASMLKSIRVGGTIKDDNDNLIYLVLGDCYDNPQLIIIAQEIINSMNHWLTVRKGNV